MQYIYVYALYKYVYCIYFQGTNTLIMNLLTSFTDEKVPTTDDSHKDGEIEFLDDDENNDWIGNSDVVLAAAAAAADDNEVDDDDDNDDNIYNFR